MCIYLAIQYQTDCMNCYLQVGVMQGWEYWKTNTPPCHVCPTWLQTDQYSEENVDTIVLVLL